MERFELSSKNPTLPESKSESFYKEWTNEVFAFAEVKEGKWSGDRSEEEFEAMEGTPTTRTLYLNAVTTAVALYVSSKQIHSEFEVYFFGRDVHDCGHRF